MADPTMLASPKTGMDNNLVNANLLNVRKLSMLVGLSWLKLKLTRSVAGGREMMRELSVK